MITAVSLNPSIDRTLHIDQMNVGGLNRVVRQIDAAAGKGVNVALGVSALEGQAECIGFMYEEGSALFAKRLGAAGIESDFLLCDGAVRVNTKVLDLEKGEITEFNTSGVPVTPQQIECMTELVEKHARKDSFLILSGSMPPGCPTDYYRILAEAARAKGARVVLDADGERLRLAMSAHPFMIKPNRYELELLTGRQLTSIRDVLDAAAECVRQGVSVVVVSLGAEGAVITDGKEAWRAQAKSIEVRSTVAAGDTMIAGLVIALSKDYDLCGALRAGVAAATVRCMTDPDEMIDVNEYRGLYESIIMEKLL